MFHHFFSNLCYLGLNSLSQPVVVLTVKTLLCIFSIHIIHWLNIYIPTFGSYLRTSLETALFK